MSNREATRKAWRCGATPESLSRGEEDGRTRSEKNVAALGMCERSRGLRELRKTSNDKNMAYHSNHVSACKREKKLLL